MRLSANCPVRLSGFFWAFATGDESLGVRLADVVVVDGLASALAGEAGRELGWSTRATALDSSRTWLARSGCCADMDGASGCWQPASRSGENSRINPRGFRSNRGIVKAFRIGRPTLLKHSAIDLWKQKAGHYYRPRHLVGAETGRRARHKLQSIRPQRYRDAIRAVKNMFLVGGLGGLSVPLLG